MEINASIINAHKTEIKSDLARRHWIRHLATAQICRLTSLPVAGFCVVASVTRSTSQSVLPLLRQNQTDWRQQVVDGAVPASDARLI